MCTSSGREVYAALPRSSSPDLSMAADAVAELASLVASRRSLKSALLEWDRVAPQPCRAAAQAFRRRMLLTYDEDTRPDVADGYVSLFHPIVTAAAAADRRSGSACIASLRSSAESLRSRVARLGDASASTAGAVLSGRMVAGLPLVFLLFAPIGGRPRFDGVGLTILAAGIALVLGGMRWIRRVMPTPAQPAAAIAVVRDLAAHIRSGIPVAAALSFQAAACEWAPLQRALCSVRLGISWEEALGSSGDRDARTLGTILAAAKRRGGGIAELLDEYGVELAEVDRRSFERRLRRAPVLMVLPLVFCLLPGFALLTLGPFLRSLLT